MPESALPVEYLFTMKAQTAPGTVIAGGPQGERITVPVPGGSFAGPRIKGTLVPNSGGDWVTRRADGSFQLDVRVTLLTDDGAPIYMSYKGMGVVKDGALALRTAPLFETGDERYAWLNRIQAIGWGSAGQGWVEYDVYALQV